MLTYLPRMKISSAARKEYTAGEIINLVAVDTEHLQNGLYWTHMVYSAPLTIAVALYQLWLQLGVTSLTTLGIIFTSMPLNLVLSIKAASYQSDQMGIKVERLKHITEVRMALVCKNCTAGKPRLRK